MRDPKSQHAPAADGFDEKVIQISRVSKKTKGGNKAGFSVLMVVGDKKGSVGVGLGKAKDVLSAIKKGVKKAKKKMIKVPLNGTTIPFAVQLKQGASRVMLKPAPKGSGVIAGGPVRAVVEAAGVRDISSKILGTGNQASNVYATFAALQRVKALVAIKGLKLKSVAESEAEEREKTKALQEKHQKRAESQLEGAKKETAAKAPKVAKTEKATKTNTVAKTATVAAPAKTKKPAAPKEKASTK